jgi:hypothetical protein
MILLENSYNHGGALMNNNGENKCIYHKVESLKKLATLPYLVDALESEVSTLVDFIEDDSSDEVL